MVIPVFIFYSGFKEKEPKEIPAINQVVMLRPTESAIVFIQQLGRGLSKAAEDAKKFDSMLSELQKELFFGKRLEQHESQYKKYFEVKTTPKRGIQVTAKTDAIKAAKRYYGYFVLLSNEKWIP